MDSSTVGTNEVFNNASEFIPNFGPNNLSHVIRFIDILGQKLQTHQTKKICLVSAMDADKRANAAYLMCAYMMLVYKLTPEQAYQPLFSTSPGFVPYRDAGYGPATYHISILDCLQGLYRSLQVGLLHLDSINLEAYEFYEKVENGDMNWITDKFLALASPKDDVTRFPSSFSLGRFGLPPLPKKENVPPGSSTAPLYSVTPIENLIRYFKENNVCTIVRLNNKLYERKKFVDAGIEHIEMYFPDGSTPPDHILQEFLRLCENRKGVIAVHCKAGLGRTGSLIAAYLMKHYRLTAAETISFLRIVRPGSVVGPQQNWLQSMQNKIWSWTPEKSIDPSVSLLKPSSLQTYKRFDTYRLALPLPSSLIQTFSPTIADKIEYTLSSDDESETEDQRQKKVQKNTQQSQKMGADQAMDLDESVIQNGTSSEVSSSAQQNNIMRAVNASSSPSPSTTISATSVYNTRSSSGIKSHFRVVKGNNTIHKNMTEHMAVPIQPRKGMSNPSLDQDEPLAQEANPNFTATANNVQVTGTVNSTPTPDGSHQSNRYEDYVASLSKLSQQKQRPTTASSQKSSLEKQQQQQFYVQNPNIRRAQN